MPAPYKDVVVFIPGILGSTLAKQGTPVWGTGGKTILNAMFEGFDALTLPEAGSLKPDLADGISVTGLTANIEIVPGFWKLGGYSRISRTLGNLPGLVRGHNYFDFPYDWRRDNRVAALRLRNQTQSWLQNWIHETHHPDAKLVLVVHSMGGLVARYFIECLEGWRTTRMLIAAGSPFRGSGNALDFLVNGAALPAPFAGLSHHLNSFREIDSIYQLLPTYRFVRKRNGELQYVAEADYLPLVQERVRYGRVIHEEIEKAEIANHAIEEYRTAECSLRTIVGINQQTIESVIWDEGRLSPTYDWDGRTHGGDTVVARPSATPLNRSEDIAMFTTNSHAAMPGDNAVLSHIKGLLSSPDLDLARFRKEYTSTLTLELEDVAAANVPIPVHARAIGNNQKGVSATAEHDGQEVLTISLNSTDGVNFTGELLLEPGNYLVRINADNAPEVADVIAVLG